jgi:gamma-glutamyltranspeptidase/glutathione hydrolase
MKYQNSILHRSRFNRGTTHMSVADRWGNVASLTVSNGEGCGHIVPGTGIMLNNMLGEEDLNPHGFQQWQLNTRLSSMMAPALIRKNDGTIIALGSGGSNRIRSAILQVIVNLLDYDMPLYEAVQHPRLHLENDLLSLEPGFDEEVLKTLLKDYPARKRWSEQSLFFGGVHAVQINDGGFVGAGDARRGGEACVVKQPSS